MIWAIASAAAAAAAAWAASKSAGSRRPAPLLIPIRSRRSRRR